MNSANWSVLKFYDQPRRMKILFNIPNFLLAFIQKQY